MTIPPKRQGEAAGKKRSILEAMDLPPKEGKCAFGGEYVDDGTVVDWFGDKYRCDAPNLVKIPKAQKAKRG